MTLETAEFKFDIKEVGSKGEFEGYASTFGNIDNGGDIIAPEAFDKALEDYREKGIRPKMLWQHDWSEVIGIWDSMSKDESGLKVKGKLILDLPRAKEVHTLLTHKAIDGLSIGFRTRDAEYVDNTGVRMLKDIDLKEISVVTFPMNESATVTGVKHLDSLRDVERILRDAGVPGNFAKLVAKHGYEAAAKMKDQRDADLDEQEAISVLHNLQKLKGKFHA